MRVCVCVCIDPLTASKKREGNNTKSCYCCYWIVTFFRLLCLDFSFLGALLLHFFIILSLLLLSFILFFFFFFARAAVCWMDWKRNTTPWRLSHLYTFFFCYTISTHFFFFFFPSYIQSQTIFFFFFLGRLLLMQNDVTVTKGRFFSLHHLRLLKKTTPASIKFPVQSETVLTIFFVVCVCVSVVVASYSISLTGQTNIRYTVSISPTTPSRSFVTRKKKSKHPVWHGRLCSRHINSHTVKKKKKWI